MGSQLSKKQVQALGASIRLIEACPGAGKTRTIVERYRSLCENKDKGVALLSFTNAAVEEALSRSTNVLHAPDSYNYIGTFDSFIHHFIVTPWFRRVHRKNPSYLNSWDELPESLTLLKARNVRNGTGIPLSCYGPDEKGEISFMTHPPQLYRSYVAQLAKENMSPHSLVGEAKKKIVALTSKGIFDCDNARLQALEIFRDRSNEWLGRHLGARFKEIIIDEFQDCSVIEHLLIERFNKLGIRVVVVADPDQSIYEFRKATPNLFVKYKNTLRSDEVVVLDENYRSSEVICKVVSSMRAVGAGGIKSKANFNGLPYSKDVVVCVGSPEFQRRTFRSKADDMGIETSSSIVLAHTKKGAAELAGNTVSNKSGSGGSGKLLRVLVTFRESRDAIERRRALSSGVHILIGAFDWPPDIATKTIEEKLGILGCSLSNFSLVIRSILREADTWEKIEEPNQTMLSVIKEHFGNMTIPLVKTLGSRFQKLKEDDWEIWLRSFRKASDNLPALHIHAVKGMEYDAVMLEIPSSKPPGSPHILTDWEVLAGSEALRVLYVGASRARRLLQFAISKKHEAQLLRILGKAGIDYEVIRE